MLSRAWARQSELARDTSDNYERQFLKLRRKQRVRHQREEDENPAQEHRNRVPPTRLPHARVEQPREQPPQNERARGPSEPRRPQEREPVWKSTSVSGAPDNSSRSHFSAMTRSCWVC